MSKIDSTNYVLDIALVFYGTVNRATCIAFKISNFKLKSVLSKKTIHRYIVTVCRIIPLKEISWWFPFKHVSCDPEIMNLLRKVYHNRNVIVEVPLYIYCRSTLRLLTSFLLCFRFTFFSPFISMSCIRWKMKIW